MDRHRRSDDRLQDDAPAWEPEPLELPIDAPSSRRDLPLDEPEASRPGVIVIDLA